MHIGGDIEASEYESDHGYYYYYYLSEPSADYSHAPPLSSWKILIAAAVYLACQIFSLSAWC